MRRWVPSWRFVLGAIAALVVLTIAGLAYAYSQVTIPAAEQFATAQKTIVYYDDGKTVMGTFGAQNRVIVDGDDLPKYVRQVFVASEDRTFYQNTGISPRGIVRALVNNLRGGSQQGGSTITQQYAERYYLGETKSYAGKLKEAFLAIKLARHQDKDEILDNYINTIYLGRGAYGIQTAAQKYFGVGADKLTLSQAALIAGIVPSPGHWDPRVDKKIAKQRWNRVLDAMVDLGWLSPDDRADQKFPKTIKNKHSDTYGGTDGYLLSMVRDEASSRADLSEEELDTRGLKIVTTVDPAMQKQAVKTMGDMPDDTPKGLRESLVSVDADSGAIRALYGGPDYLKQQYNNVTQGSAQAGSTFKPFALLAALEEGKSLDTIYDGNNDQTITGFDRPVTNFAGVNWGHISLLKATAFSVNTVFAALNTEIGPEKTEDAAIRAGIPKDTAGLNDLPSNVLGTASVHPIDLAHAYSTIADEGVRHPTHIVASIKTISGNKKVYTAPTKGTKEFDPDVTASTVYAMQQVVRYGSGKAASSLGRPIAGKTGTSSENKSAWFAGFTPSLVTVVGINEVGPGGTEESITPFGGYSDITGGSVPLDLWTTYMGAVLDGTPSEDFPPRPTTTPTSTPTPDDDADEKTEESDKDEKKDNKPDKPKQVSVPAGVVGASEQKATKLLTDAGLKVKVSRSHADAPEGTVLSSSPGAGAKVDAGGKVTIVVSRGPKEQTTPSPDPDGSGSDDGGDGGSDAGDDGGGGSDSGSSSGSGDDGGGGDDGGSTGTPTPGTPPASHGASSTGHARRR